MKCPHCGEEIDNSYLARESGREGGKRSKRTLTPEQARAMVEKREENKRKKEYEASQVKEE